MRPTTEKVIQAYVHTRRADDGVDAVLFEATRNNRPRDIVT